MTAQSIVQIQIEDGQFKAFLELWQKYQTQLGAQSAAWREAGSAATEAARDAAGAGEQTAEAWEEAGAAATGAGEAATGAGSESATAWARTGKTVRDTLGGFGRTRTAAAGVGGEVRRAATAQDRFKNTAVTTGRTFSRMARDTKAIAGHIKGATLSLLKWTGLTGLFAGLAGAGGLFGIERLAQSASEQRRTSQGLGVTAPERNAAQINFSKLVDVDQVLSNINAVRTDLSKRWALNGVGLAPAQIQGKSNADVLKLLLPALKQQFARAGGTLQGAQAHGLTEFVDIATLTRLKAVQGQEIDAALKAYEKDKAALALADQTQQSWQQLNTQLQRAGVSIENEFIKKLAGLTGPLTDLSAAFSQAVKTLLDSPKVGAWIQELGAGIQKFSKYLVSDEFQLDAKTALDALDRFAGAVYKAAKFLGSVFGGGAERTLKGSEYRKLEALEEINPKLAARVRDEMENPKAAKEFSWWQLKGADTRRDETRALTQAAEAGPRGVEVTAILRALGRQADTARVKTGRIIPAPQPPQAARAAPSPTTRFDAGLERARPAPATRFDAAVRRVQPAPVPGIAAGAAPARVQVDLSAIERKNQLPAGLLAAVERKESGGNPNAVGPVTRTGERAKGAFQLMSGVMRDYKVRDPFDRADAARGAAESLHDLLAKYKGDLAKSLAAYNWGQGNVDRKGLAQAPAETRDYVATILGDLAKRKTAQADAVRATLPQISPRVAEARAAAPAPAPVAPRAPLQRAVQPLMASITVTNNTGGAAVVIANQVAQ